MKIPLNWLRDYVQLDADVDGLCDTMTMLGLEIEHVERPGDEIDQVVVGRIVAIEPHPDADKLVVCRTDVGQGEPAQIVCGATNMNVGDRVPTALVGGALPGGFKIGKRKMRGVESQGMMCSPRELGLGEEHEGLMILEGDLRVGDDIRAPLGLDEVILDIEVTPNRNDWSGLIGVARELAAAYGLPFAVPKIALVEGDKRASGVSSVTIKDPGLCPRYVGRLLGGVKLGPSPAWLARRLIAAGQRPINNVVDVTNYVLIETGQPLHAFDTKKLEENRIVVRRAREGERITTIDQSEHVLAPEMLVIADAKAPVAIAGIMGGHGSEVGEGSTEIFLESAYFDPVSIRRTSRALNLITEASQRFQRGADVEMAAYASERASQLIAEVCGGELYRGTLDAYPKPAERRQISLRFARTHSLLGMDVPGETQRSYLEALGFETVAADGAGLTVRVPTWRHDATLEADLIEEIARLDGYEKVPVTLPRVRSVDEVYAPEEDTLRRLADYLAGAGLTETIRWTFMAPEDLARAGLDPASEPMVLLDNPLSEKQAGMRTKLLPGLIETASANIRKRRGDVAIFELGPVYRSKGGDRVDQRYALGLALSEQGPAKHWSRPEQPSDLFDLKGIIEGVLEFMGVRDAAFEPAELPGMVPGRVARIRANGNVLGRLGEICPSVLERYDVEQRLFVAEMDLQPLLKKRPPRVAFSEVPAHPPSLRDLAVVVDAATPAGALRAAAQRAGGKLLQSVEIFDVYTGKPIPDRSKSVALGLVFQSAERTLTDKDTDKALEKILKALAREFNAERR